MISMFRIDFRLLHYQTSQVWPKKLDINMIVVANDAVDVYKRQGCIFAMKVIMQQLAGILSQIWRFIRPHKSRACIPAVKGTWLVAAEMTILSNSHNHKI